MRYSTNVRKPNILMVVHSFHCYEGSCGILDLIQTIESMPTLYLFAWNKFYLSSTTLICLLVCGLIWGYRFSLLWIGIKTTTFGRKLTTSASNIYFLLLSSRVKCHILLISSITTVVSWGLHGCVGVGWSPCRKEWAVWAWSLRTTHSLSRDHSTTWTPSCHWRDFQYLWVCRMYLWIHICIRSGSFPLFEAVTFVITSTHIFVSPMHMPLPMFSKLIEFYPVQPWCWTLLHWECLLSIFLVADLMPPKLILIWTSTIAHRHQLVSPWCFSSNETMELLSFNVLWFVLPIVRNYLAWSLWKQNWLHSR